MKKRFLAFFLCALMLCTMLPVTVLAEETTDEPVARMSIFSYCPGSNGIGHSWLYFENLSNSDITVGAYTLAPGAGVSVGTFKHTRSDGAGVYYNVEAYCTNRYGASGRISISQDITASELQNVSSTINSNNRWTLVRNCAWFAERVWNCVADTTVWSGLTPSCLKTSIKVESKFKYQINAAMQAPDAAQVYKQNGSKLVTVSKGTLDHGL